MRILRALTRESIADTWGHCPDCGSVVEADMVEKDGGVYLRRRCPDHGEALALQSRDPKWFRMIETILPPVPEPELIQPIDHARHLRGLFIDLTEACNMQCPNCLTDANAPMSGNPPTIEGTMRSLSSMLPYKPVLYLTGGEPTLRPDILDWIRTLSGAGYDVKMLTNGLKLRDKDFCREIRDAGVTWVLLQFDSRREDFLKELRGRGGLAGVREQVVENLVELGMNIDLACMVDREFNMNEMGELLRYGFHTPGVRHVSFMPSRRLGRGHLTSDDNMLFDTELMDAISEQTNGAIDRRDWGLFLAAVSVVYKFTKNPDFAPRRCFLPLPLVGTEKGFWPVTRMRGMADPRNLAAFLMMASNAGRAESARWNERTLLTSIETFREPGTIDVGDASRCSRYYLVDDGVRQACLYNVITRPVRRAQFQEAQQGILPQRMRDRLRAALGGGA